MLKYLFKKHQTITDIVSKILYVLFMKDFFPKGTINQLGTYLKDKNNQAVENGFYGYIIKL
jgi:hypothetical protein